MRFSEIGRWQAAIGMVALLPMLISASPLQSVKRDNDEYHECMTPDSKRWYVYNKNGKPSPRDLQVATNPDYGGRPNDLSSLAILRAMIELNPSDIEALVVLREEASNEDWISSDYDCGATSGEERWLGNGLSFTETASPTFKASWLHGMYDNAEGSVWPLIIQDQLKGRYDFEHPDWYPNIVRGGAPGFFDYTHETKPNPALHVLAQYLWESAGHEDATASTDEVAKQTDGVEWVSEIIKNTKTNETPCLLATNADTQGEFKGETVYTIGFGQDGSILARDVQAPSSDDPLKVTIEDIAKHIAYITHFETKPAEDDSSTE